MLNIWCFLGKLAFCTDFFLYKSTAVLLFAESLLGNQFEVIYIPVLMDPKQEELHLRVCKKEIFLPVRHSIPGDGKERLAHIQRGK